MKDIESLVGGNMMQHQLYPFVYELSEKVTCAVRGSCWREINKWDDVVSNSVVDSVTEIVNYRWTKDPSVFTTHLI